MGGAVRVIEGTEARDLAPAAKWDLLSPYLRRHGREAWSYATLQDGMEYLLVEGVGYWSYLSARHPLLAPRGMKAVLSDPLCAIEDQPAMVAALLDHCPRACFAPVSTSLARVLRPLGFKCVCTGTEPLVPLGTYPLEGDWKGLDLVRRARNEARRHGLRFQEVPRMDAVDVGELRRISDKWLESKAIHDREIRVYARPPVYADEPDVRKFVARDREGRVAGFAFYDPLYRDGRIFGYSANLSRCDEARFGKLATALHMHAARVFRDEGCEVLNLCLSPFQGLGEAEFEDDRLTAFFFGLSRRYGRHIYNFGGLALHRERYRVGGEVKYFASRALLPPNDAYLAYRAAGMVDGYGSMAWDLLKGIAEGLAGPNGRRRKA